MGNRKRLILIITGIMAVFIFDGCKSIQNVNIAYIYHNITARYNIYFNGYEEFKKITKSIENDHQDYYNGILDIYQFADEKAARSIFSSADMVLRKCTKLIDKHKISKWIDDSYFLIGKAHFYKRDYFAAIETFEYVKAKYKDSKLAFESMIWVVLCNIQLEKYDEAQAILTLIKSDKGFPSSLEKELWLAEAFVNIRTEDYISAIKNLEDVIPKERKKYYKTRYLFIMAQLFQETESYSKASEIYKLVIKKNPPYEMAFNAKIGMSKCIQVESERDARSVKNLLHKMLKDDKNIQYYDQIYYELALIELKLNNLKEAEKYLMLCLVNSNSNQNLKALAYLALAEYHYNNSNYIPAKAYYDSSAMNLSPSFPGYKEINDKNRVLRELLSYLVIIENEDSLQYLATVDKPVRDSIIDVAYKEEQRLIREQKKLEREQRMREARDQEYDNQLLRNRNLMPGGGPGGFSQSRNTWYFSSPSAVDIGKSEFNVRWGKRPLEDDWRRKKKIGSSFIIDEEDDGFTEKEKDSVILSEAEKEQLESIIRDVPKDKQKYYLDIPLTESLMKASHKSIKEALMGAGGIYSEKLYDEQKAIEAYEDLLKRYPEYKRELQIHYRLYKLYGKTGNEKMKEQHRQYILKNHPDSDYALLLKDPKGFKERIDKRNAELESLYQETYDLFLVNNCDQVVKNVNECKSRYKRNPFEAKFQYLKTICIGRSSTSTEFIDLLKSFIKRYDDEEIVVHANNVLAYLLKFESEIKEELIDSTGVTDSVTIDSVIITSLYNFNEESPHYFIFSFPPSSYNANDLKISFSNFNSQYHQLDNLETLTFVFDERRKFLVVKQFIDGTKAGRYVDDIILDKVLMAQIRTDSPEFIVISIDNFGLLMKEKNINQYQHFYEEYYQN